MSAPVSARRTLSVMLVVLVVLHVVPLPIEGFTIAGFLPWDLGYHLLWMAAATLVVLYMTGPAWPDEEPPQRQPPLSSDDGGDA